MEDGFFKFSNLSKFPEVVQGVSIRSLGNMKMVTTDDETIENRKNMAKALGVDFNSVVKAEGIHGNKIATVDKKDAGRGMLNQIEAIKGVDGLITTEPNVFLMVTVADCLPILAYDPINRIVGIVHAGWRGLLSGAASELIEAFKQKGSYAEDILVGIGPAICQKHFIVKNDTLKQFATKCSKAVLLRNRDGYVDLKRCAEEELLAKGISKVNLEVAKECTACNSYYFSSFRYEGEKTIFHAAIIGMRG